MLRNKKFQLIISLLIAIALWLYVVGDTDPNIKANINDIQVEMVGEDVLEELGMSATLDGPETVDITVSGSRSNINALKDGELRATVDVSNCNYGENKEEINIVIPEDVSGITIETMSEDNASFTVE